MFEVLGHTCRVEEDLISLDASCKQLQRQRCDAQADACSGYWIHGQTFVDGKRADRLRPHLVHELMVRARAWISSDTCSSWLDLSSKRQSNNVIVLKFHQASVVASSTAGDKRSSAARLTT